MSPSKFSTYNIVRILTEDQYSYYYNQIEDILPLYSLKSLGYFKEYYGAEKYLLIGLGFSDIEGITFCYIKNNCIMTHDIELLIPVFLDNIDPDVKALLIKEYLSIFNDENKIKFTTGLLTDLKGLKLLEFNRLGFSIGVQTALVAKIEESYEVQRRQFRKSYKSLINRAYKHLSLDILTGESTDLISKFRQLEEFHMSVAGRRTRSRSTWDLQCEMVRAKEAFVVRAFHGRELLGFNLIIYNSNLAYYGVGVYSREHKEMSIGHVIQAETFKKLIELKIKSYYLGDFFGRKGDKVYRISEFKKGFAQFESIKVILSRE